MVDAPGLAATLTLKFNDAEALAEALRVYSGAHGSGGLCIQVVKYYELGDAVRLSIDFVESTLDLHAVVAWRKPGYIGVRFDPRSSQEAKHFAFLKMLLGEAGKGAAVAPPVAPANKPFAE